MWFRNQDGVALMMTLMVSAIAISVMASLMYIMVSGTRISGLNKRFTTALEAGRGGQAVMLEYIGTRGRPDADFMNAISFDSSGTSDTCLDDKLNKATANWALDGTCDSRLTIDTTDDQTYDFKFDLDAYTIYTKIVNTIEGNTGGGKTSEQWVTTGVVTAGGGGAGGSGSIEVVPVPYLYTIELDARKGTRADAEKAKLSILYQY